MHSSNQTSSERYSKLIDEENSEFQEKTQSEPSTFQHPVFLLDVDGTLIKHDGDFNHDLIEKLKSSGIKDIYLFTNMSLKDIAEKKSNPDYKSRPDLVSYLEKQGFKIYGVITPADVGYKKGLGKAYEDIYLPQYIRSISNNEGLILTSNALQKDEAYIEAESNFSKLSYSEERKEFSEVKGAMFKYFLENKASWIGGCIFLDDAEVQLDATKEVLAHHPYKFSLYTLKITNDSQNYAHQFDGMVSDIKKNLGVREESILGQELSTPAVNIESGPTQVSVDFSDSFLSLFLSANMGNTWQTNDESIKKKAEITDIFRGGFTSRGLPYGVMLDGCGKYASYTEISRIGEIISNLIKDFEEELNGKSYSSDEIMTRFKELYKDLDSMCQMQFGSEASLSGVVLYKNEEGNLHALSFGTGDTLVAMDNGKKVETVIAARGVLKENSPAKPLSFPSQPGLRDTTIEKVIENLEINVREVREGDRFIFLTDGAYEHLNLEQENLIVNGTKMVRSTLSENALNPGTTPCMITSEAHSVSKKIFEEQSNEGIISHGDDCSVASLLVPTIEQHQQLKQTLCLENGLTEVSKKTTSTAKKLITGGLAGIGTFLTTAAACTALSVGAGVGIGALIGGATAASSAAATLGMLAGLVLGGAALFTPIGWGIIGLAAVMTVSFAIGNVLIKEKINSIQKNPPSVTTFYKESTSIITGNDNKGKGKQDPDLELVT